MVSFGQALTNSIPVSASFRYTGLAATELNCTRGDMKCGSMNFGVASADSFVSCLPSLSVIALQVTIDTADAD